MDSEKRVKKIKEKEEKKTRDNNISKKDPREK
jgi:hypothetical protein